MNSRRTTKLGILSAIMPIAFLLLGMCTNTATAEVISSSQIQFSVIPSQPTEYSAYIKQTTVTDPVHADYTGLNFVFTGTSLTPTMTLLDEGCDWYLAQAGNTFSAATIAANQFPVIFSATAPLTPPPVTIPLGDFYLGVSTGIGITNGKPNRSVFGWVKLHNTGTQLTALGNAVDYGDGGIIIGSATAVPEPTSLVLLATPLAFLAATRRRRVAAKGL